MRRNIGVLGLTLSVLLVVVAVAEPPPVWDSGTNSVSPAPRRVDAETGPSATPTASDLDADPAYQAGAGQGGAVWTPPATRPENTIQTGSAGPLIGFSGSTASGSQTIALVHSGKMQIAVYHIDAAGQIRLVSSRPIDADFSVTLNPTEPLPGQIRLLGSRMK